jgi:hypothetical protein
LFWGIPAEDSEDGDAGAGEDWEDGEAGAGEAAAFEPPADGDDEVDELLPPHPEATRAITPSAKLASPRMEVCRVVSMMISSLVAGGRRGGVELDGGSSCLGRGPPGALNPSL